MPGEEPGGGNDPRIDMAAERTFLAWIRTATALMAIGIVVLLSLVGIAMAGLLVRL